MEMAAWFIISVRILNNVPEPEEKINECSTNKSTYSNILYPGKFRFEKENETNGAKQKPYKLQEKKTFCILIFHSQPVTKNL